jgi:hypothetical protein
MKNCKQLAITLLQGALFSDTPLAQAKLVVSWFIVFITFLGLNL